ncbi:MAG: hypothetical protein AAGA03_18385, partial [Planctomycetota bacterium]
MRHPCYLTAAILLLLIAQIGTYNRCLQAGTVSPYQSQARPFGLDVVGPVQLAGSDARSQTFQSEALPTFQQTVATSLG